MKNITVNNMKRIHNFESFNEHLQLDGYTSSPNLSRATEIELSIFKKALKKYSTEKKLIIHEDGSILNRAIELLDEIKDEESLYFWLLNGKTLKLQELLRKTTYNGNGNTPEQLRDFNAFAMLDTVRMSYMNEAQRPWFKNDREESLYDKVQDIQKELDDLRDERSQLDTDMEEEAGRLGDKWTDKEANEYGALMNKKDEEIEKKLAELKKTEEKYDSYGKTRAPKETTEEAKYKKVLVNNLIDIKKSIKSWPSRTPEEQAVIYKKRYFNQGASIELIVNAIKELQSENKI